MTISIHQPNFLPWYGYFHKIIQSDKFIFFDNVQMPVGRSFVSRTKVLIANNANWLSIPVLGKSTKSSIKDILIDNTQNWQKKHLHTIELNYLKAPHFEEIFTMLCDVYEGKFTHLIDFNTKAIIKILHYLEFKNDLFFSSKLVANKYENTTDYLVALIKDLNGSKYLSGSGEGSKRYVDEALFSSNGIELLWHKPVGIIYEQFNSGEFIPNLSIIDLLFNKGIASKELLLYTNINDL